MTDARRAGIVTLIVLLAGAPLLVALPTDVGGVRLAGVSLFWWYGGLVVPFLAALATCLVLILAPRTASFAVWLGPALFGAIAYHVFAGAVEAPLLASVAAAAPLLVLLGRVPADPPDALTVTVALLGLALVIWANLSAVSDVVRALGGPSWLGLTLGTLLALIPAGGPAADRWRTGLLGVGTAALAVPLLVIAVSATPPWVAWRQQAMRPAPAFDPRSPWVAEGGVVLVPATLAFTEVHRITALSEGLYRVVEHDGDRATVREWRVGGGDALTLRAGDELTVPAGARIKFEAGKRVPGTAASGSAWADPRERQAGPTLGTFLGLSITLVGGAAVLLKPRERPGGRLLTLGGPILPFALVAAAVCSGVYAALAGPELGLGAPTLASILRSPSVLVGPAVGSLLLGAAVLGVGSLYVATVSALRSRAQELTRPLWPRRAVPGASLLWLVMLIIAAALTAWSADAWRALMLGCGVVASAVLAPALAAPGLGGRVAGGLVGAGIFATLAFVGSGSGGAPVAITAYPALIAAPLAWATAALVRLAGRAES